MEDLPGSLRAVTGAPVQSHDVLLARPPTRVLVAVHSDHGVRHPPARLARRDLVAALKAERAIRKTNPNRSPNFERICQAWPHQFNKVALAEALWPLLQAKVHRDIASGNRLYVPAARVGARALRMALSPPRRHVALRVR